MTGTALRLGELQAEGFVILRSGVNWLRPDGHACRPREIIGYCNIALRPRAGGPAGPNPFAAEPDLHAAFAPRRAGRLRIAPDVSLGGYLNDHAMQFWDPGARLGDLLPLEDGAAPPEEEAVLLLLLAGRRVTGLSAAIGLLPAWNRHVRGWWGEGGSAPASLLSLAICDGAGAVQGDGAPFADMFAAAGPVHVVVVPNHPVTPCAPCLLDQMTRTPEASQAIREDIIRVLAAGPVSPAPDDFLFAGALLAALDHAPLRESFELLTPAGLRKSGPPGAILLSLIAEHPIMPHHKTLGYRLSVLDFNQAAAGPAMRAWLADAFEPVVRTIDDVRRDYVQLIDAVAAQSGARCLILNRMSSSGHEDVSTYAAFDAPMRESLAYIAAKELNLMLHDLSAERDVAIIDVDALGAELGGARHLPDGVHQSGQMQAAVRGEILRAMALPRAGKRASSLRA